MRGATLARAAGAAALAAAAWVGLRAGGVSVAVAATAAAGTVLFALWRTVAGACVAFTALVASAVLAVVAADVTPILPRGLAAPLLALEAFGWITVAAVARVRDDRRISRRLLGAWLASSGALAVGLGLVMALPDRAAGSVLIALGLAHRLGVVPVYAWAPLLMRHPASRITALGFVATAAAAATLLFVLGRLPDADAAARTLRILSAVTFPWAVWHAVRQWRRDRRCALSYAAVAAVSGALVAAARR